MVEKIDYWDKFCHTGSVRDYLCYRNSVKQQTVNNERREYYNNRYSSQGDKNQRK